VPGHGAVQRDCAYLDRLMALISATRTQVAALVAAGATRDVVRRTVDGAALAAPFAGDDAWRRRWFARYWTAPFVERAYHEATGAPLVEDR
jgi:hypothetical protein